VTALRSSEQHFQTQVEQLAKFYGWRVFHAPDNRPSGKTGRVQRVTPGFPDLVLLRPPELIFAELKTATGKVSDDQEAWLQDLAAVSKALVETVEISVEQADINLGVAVDAYLWRPADFDEINARLARGRHLTMPLYRAGEPAA
jgi:hypothetical protein